MEKVIVHQEFSGFSEVFKPYGAQDDVPDLGDDDIPSVVEKLRHDGAIAAEMAKSSGRPSVVFDWGIPPSDDVDSEENSPFYKLPQIVKDDGKRTLAKKLGIVRTEEVTTASGDMWVHAFNSNNELVDARLVKSA
jgi:hypothetical protein